MLQTKTARLFKNGASQAVRLPAEFRFAGEDVYATRDDATGDVVLSTRPGAHVWSEFFALMESVDVPEAYMAERPLNTPPLERALFASDEL